MNLKELKDYQKLQDEFLNKEQKVAEEIQKMYKIWNALFEKDNQYINNEMRFVISIDNTKLNINITEHEVEYESYYKNEWTAQLPMKFVENLSYYEKGYNELQKQKELEKKISHIRGDRNIIIENYLNGLKLINDKAIKEISEKKRKVDEELTKKINEYKIIKNSETLKNIEETKQISEAYKKDLKELQKQQNIYKSQLNHHDVQALREKAEEKYKNDHAEEYQAGEEEINRLKKQIKKHEKRIKEICDTINNDQEISSGTNLE